MTLAVFTKSLRLYHTVRYLKLEQLIGRLRIRFRRVVPDYSPPPRLASIEGNWQRVAQRQPRMSGPDQVTFLNESAILSGSACWNNPAYSKLWLYNLHYFDDLNAVDSENRHEWHRQIIQRWIEENPPGQFNGWEPYPTSLRIVNWIKWALSGNTLEAEWIQSLAIQVRYLKDQLEWHLLGNHLFCNAKALLMAGLFFEGSEAQEWYELGSKIIERELPEQVLPDGGNFELSTMYHAIFLEDLLDLLNCHRAYVKEMPVGIGARIPAMIDWLAAMCHPDGEISFFNDAALGVTPAVADLLGYANRLGFINARLECGLIEFPDSGYSRVTLQNASLIVDRAAIGPEYLPGHAHADTLSFELSLFGQRVIVNSGTSVYGTGLERQRQRGTAAHATLVIDEQNSSHVWGGFRVAQRARVFQKDTMERDGKFYLSACHDGYRYLPGKPIHCRKWILSDNCLEIQDSVRCQKQHNMAVVFPLHPELSIVQFTGSCVHLSVSGHLVKVQFFGEGSLCIEDANYHPEFGKSIESKKLIYRLRSEGLTNIRTHISW